jgi:hypothetical protein
MNLYGGEYKIVEGKTFRLDSTNEWVRSTMSIPELMARCAVKPYMPNPPRKRYKAKKA